MPPVAQTIAAHHAQRERPLGTNQARQISADRAEIRNAVQWAEVRDGAVKSDSQGTYLLDGHRPRVDTPRSCDFDHLRSGVYAEHFDVARRQVNRVVAGSAAQIQNAIARPKQLLKLLPRLLALRSPAGRF